MAIKFSQFNLRTDHTSGMYLVGYDGNQNIHITVDNLFNDFINGTENTIAMFGTGGTVLADSILSQNAGATLLTVGGQLNVDAAATFDTSVTVTGNSALNGNVTLGDASTDLITQTGTLYLNGPVKDTADTLGAVDQILVSDATGELTFQDLLDTHVGSAEVVKVPVKNVQGSALAKGDPVYISGSVGASGRLQVQLADASNTLKMPSVGLLFQDLANNAEGYVVITGKLRNIGNSPIDGVTPTEGDVVYVKPSGTSGAALTTTKPVYGNFIQNVGKVGRVSTNSDGTFVVSSILRTNDIPNLTPGRLWVGSTGNTIESQTLFVDEANGRLGIGTASPSNVVHVVGNGVRIVSTATNANNGEILLGTAGNNNIPQILMGNSSNPNSFRISNAGYWSIGTYSNSDLRFNVNSTTAMHIESTNQNIGIGTTSPTSKLTIRNSGSGNSAFQVQDSGGALLMNLNEDGLGNAEVRLNNSSATQTIRLDTSGSSYFNGGNFGIGTSSPGYKLDAQTTGTADLANFETTGTAGIRIANSNTPFATRITSSNTATGLRSDGNIKFFTDGAATGTERMIIENSTGDVGIGVGTPDTRLHIKDDTSNNVAKFESVGSERSSISLKTDATSNNQAFLIFTTSADGYRRVALGPTNNPGARDMLKIEKQILPNYTSANMNFGGTGVGNSSKFTLNFDYDTDQDSNFNGFYVDANLIGTTAITGDRNVSGINVDMDSSAAGGNTAQELTLRGINVDVVNKDEGDAHHIYGVYARANSMRTAAGDNISDITGGYFQAINSAKTGQVSNMYGTYSYALLEDATHTTSNVYASFSSVKVASNFDGTISTKVTGSRVVAHLDDSNNNLVPRLIGADVENIIDSNLAISEGVNVVKDINNNLTITDSYLFKGKVEKPASSTITNNWGLYLENVDKNYLDGTLRLPTYGQGNVTGTATKSLAVDSNGNVIETEGGVVDGSGTANYVSKWSDANTLTDSQIFDNGTNVGIGTTSPAEKLVVSETRSGTTAADQTKYTLVSRSTIASGTPGTGGIKVAYYDGANEHGFGLVSGSSSADFLTSGPMHFYTNSDLNTHSATGYAMQLSNSGQLIIAGTNPITGAAKLSVAGETAISGNLGVGVTGSTSEKIDVSGTNAVIRLRNSSSTAGTASGIVFGQAMSSEVASLTVDTSTDLKYIKGSRSSGTTQFIIKSGGNVGIGEPSPAERLHISGSVDNDDVAIRIDNDSDDNSSSTPPSAAVLFNTASNNGYVRVFGAPADTAGNHKMDIGASASTSYLTFSPSGSEKMRIDSSGVVQVRNQIPTIQLFNTDTSLGDQQTLGDLDWYQSDPSGSGANVVGKIRGVNESNFQGQGALAFHTGISGGSGEFGVVERMRIDSSGNVGIGTTSPNTALEVDGAISTTTSDYVQGSTGSRLLLETSGSGNTHSYIQAQSGGGTSNAEDLALQLYGGNVGIGTDSPGYKLEVNGTLGLTGYIYHVGDSNSYFGFPINDTIIAATAGSERMRIDSSGNVGIGTTGPAELLTVSASDDVSIRINSTKNGTWTTNQKLGALEFFGNDSSANGAGLKGYINLTSVNTFGGAFNMNFGVGNNATDRMVITYDGNIGIGTTDPESKLQIQDDTTSCFVRVRAGATSIAGIEFGDSDDIDIAGIRYSNFSDNMRFNVNGSERVRIDSSGNVGINYTNPQQKLEVSGTSRFSRNGAESVQYMELIPTTAGNTLKAVGIDKSLIFDNTSSTNNFIDFRQGGQNKMRLKTGTLLIGKTSFGVNTVGIELNPVGLVQATRNGNLPLLVNRLTSDGTLVSFRRDNNQRGSISISGSTTSYNTSSDYRLKENVVDMTGALDRVEQLQPKRFNFISNAETTVDGFIAHEVQSVIPEAVFGEKDAVDDEGNPDYQGIDQSKIVPLLVGAIKELKAEIETLKSQINS